MTPELWSIIEEELHRPADISLTDLFGSRTRDEIAAMLGTPGYWRQQLAARGIGEKVIEISLAGLLSERGTGEIEAEA